MVIVDGPGEAGPVTSPNQLLPVLAALLMLAACGSGPDSSRAAHALGGPVWGPCPVTQGAPPNPRQECAVLAVPLDHDRPDGETISLAVSRIRSERPELRRGVLLIIPGGPGSPGLGRPSRYLARLPAQVRDRYDLVSFDPRGLGASTPVSCGLTGDDMVPAVLKPWPAPDGDVTANVARARRVAEACARNGGPLLAQISTRTEARDIDRIRQALGEQRLSLLGVSYGTYVAAGYATLFAEHTDRAVLDSNDDPNPELVARGWLANYAHAIEDRFPDFAGWAAARHAEYRLGTDARAVRATFLRLATELDRRPRPWPGARPAELTGNALRDLVLSALYEDAGFPLVAALLRAADTGAPLPPSPPLPEESALQNSTAVLIATVCNDVSWPRSTEGLAEAVARNRAEFPLTSGMPANLFPCTFWPPAPAEPALRIGTRAPATLLLVQNLRDPSTPHRGAVELRRTLGERARLVTVDSGGHGAYLANGNSCGDRTVSAFLAEGSWPDRDVRCPAEQR